MFEKENFHMLAPSKSRYLELELFLTHGFAPENLTPKQTQDLWLYQLINGFIFRWNYDSVLLRCLEKSNSKRVLKELYEIPAGVHFGGETTTHYILREGYYWPTLFKDSHAYARKCQLLESCWEGEKKYFSLTIGHDWFPCPTAGIRHYQWDYS